MGFILFCAALAWLIQLLALSNREKLPKGVPVLSFCLIETIPLGMALYLAVVRPERGFFGWSFGAALCLWIAGGALIGCAAAWLMDRRRRRRRK